MKQKLSYFGIKVQSPLKSITVIPAIPAPLEYSPALPVSKKCCIPFTVPLIYDQKMWPIFVPVRIKHLMLCELWVSLILQLKNTALLVGVKINLNNMADHPTSTPFLTRYGKGPKISCMHDGNNLNDPRINEKLHLTLRCFLLRNEGSKLDGEEGGVGGKMTQVGQNK